MSRSALSFLAASALLLTASPFLTTVSAIPILHQVTPVTTLSGIPLHHVTPVTSSTGVAAPLTPVPFIPLTPSQIALESKCAIYLDSSKTQRATLRTNGGWTKSRVEECLTLVEQDIIVTTKQAQSGNKKARKALPRIKKYLQKLKNEVNNTTIQSTTNVKGVQGKGGKKLIPKGTTSVTPVTPVPTPVTPPVTINSLDFEADSNTNSTATPIRTVPLTSAQERREDKCEEYLDSPSWYREKLRASGKWPKETVADCLLLIEEDIAAADKAVVAGTKGADKAAARLKRYLDKLQEEVGIEAKVEVKKAAAEVNELDSDPAVFASSPLDQGVDSEFPPQSPERMKLEDDCEEYLDSSKRGRAGLRASGKWTKVKVEKCLVLIEEDVAGAEKDAKTGHKGAAKAVPRLKAYLQELKDELVNMKAGQNSLPLRKVPAKVPANLPAAKATVKVNSEDEEDKARSPVAVSVRKGTEPTARQPEQLHDKPVHSLHFSVHHSPALIQPEKATVPIIHRKLIKHSDVIKNSELIKHSDVMKPSDVPIVHRKLIKHSDVPIVHRKLIKHSDVPIIHRKLIKHSDVIKQRPVVPPPSSYPFDAEESELADLVAEGMIEYGISYGAEVEKQEMEYEMRAEKQKEERLEQELAQETRKEKEEERQLQEETEKERRAEEELIEENELHSEEQMIWATIHDLKKLIRQIKGQEVK